MTVIKMLFKKDGFTAADGWELKEWQRDLTIEKKVKNVLVPFTALHKVTYIIHRDTGTIITSQHKAWNDKVRMAMCIDLILKPEALKRGRREAVRIFQKGMRDENFNFGDKWTFEMVVEFLSLLLLLFQPIYLCTSNDLDPEMDKLLFNHLIKKDSKFFVCNSINRDEFISQYRLSIFTLDITTVVYFSVIEPADRVYLQMYLSWIDHSLNDINNQAVTMSNVNHNDNLNIIHDSINTMYANHFIIQIVGNYNDTESIKNYIVETVSMLPAKSVFVIMNCAPSYKYYSPLSIIKGRHAAGFFNNNIMLHLNHEQPGSDYNDPLQRDSNHCYGDNADLQKIYEQFNLVVRNYYYEPYSSKSIYLPLGPSYYHVLKALDVHSSHAIKLTSERQRRCFFMGRSQYHHSGAHQRERIAIARLYHQNSFPCDYEYYAVDGLQYITYQQRLRDSVFAPCPAGNSFETYRLYEALEVGAIPVVVKPFDDRSNYLNAKEWRNYPGPVLESWEELAEYMETLYPTDRELSIHQKHRLNALQNALRKWYIDFKNSKRQELVNSLEQIFRKLY